MTGELFAAEGGLEWGTAEQTNRTTASSYACNPLAVPSTTISGRVGWEDWLKQICPTHVLMEENGGLANVIETSPDWKVVRRDAISEGTAVLLTPSRQLPGCAS